MSYANKKKEIGREHLYIVELLTDYCFLTHGTSPCAANGTGDAKCYNTFESCQDPQNFTKETARGVYRFYQSRSPAPINISSGLGGNCDAIPSLQNVIISPSKIDIGGGLGVRASVNCSFVDHPHSDIGADKYLNDRTYIASDRGSFWTKFRARNPNYQFKEMRVLSGYLVDGGFDSANFETRYYVIDKMTVTGGKCTITGKDPLKLASSKKAQAPTPSKGQLQSDITAGATSATLTPAGIGSEYATNGKILIGAEVVGFTRSGDNLTLTRGQNNTVAVEHGANDTVQQCLEYTSEQVHDIVYDLLVNYAGVSTDYITTAQLQAWQSEADTYLSGLLGGIIVKPYDVNKLLKELSEAMPHYLWWDEKQQSVQFTALKSPPSSANVLNMDENIIKLTTTDKTELRKSTVFVNFGQIDPTKKLDEPGNYLQSHARVDTDSIAKYGSSEVRTINSRWITNTNKAAALQLASLIGRRFANPPREVNFSLDAKDSDIWVGQSLSVNHRDITDFSGAPVDTIFQIISSKESKNFDYKGLEFLYGVALPEDEGGSEPGVTLVIIPPDSKNINLRTVFEVDNLPPTGSTIAKFVLQNGSVVGSTSTSAFSLDTGSWPAGATVKLIIDSGAHVVGKGGDGGTGSGNGFSGGDAIQLSHDLTLTNGGVIGGGGGGGGAAESTEPGDEAFANGGGGAGYAVGYGTSPADDGTLEVGGNGETDGIAAGGEGGDLGQSGYAGIGNITGSGGAAGLAIDKNGYTLTQTITGSDIRGNVIP